MDRHSATQDKTIRTKKDEDGKDTTIYERTIYKREEETHDKKRHHDDYASSVRSVSTYNHGSHHDQHGSARPKPDRVSIKYEYDRHLQYGREEARYEKRPKYPDKDSRLLRDLHYSDRLGDRLFDGANHGGKSKNHRNEARQSIKEFKTAFER